MLWTLLAALTFQLRQEIQRSARLSRRGAGEIKSISKSNEKNVNGNGNSPGGRTREKLGVVKFRVICYTQYSSTWSYTTPTLVFISTFKDNSMPRINLRLPEIFGPKLARRHNVLKLPKNLLSLKSRKWLKLSTFSIGGKGFFNGVNQVGLTGRWNESWYYAPAQ